MPRINTRHAHQLIEELKPFTSNGAISAEMDGAAYVVRSYATAIAVIYPNKGEAVLNGAKYSVTTTKHQTQAARGVAALGYAVTELDDPQAFTEVTGHRARIRGAIY